MSVCDLCQKNSDFPYNGDKNMESIIIGVAGGSGSGKSTFTNRIKKYFGNEVVVLYHDNCKTNALSVCRTNTFQGRHRDQQWKK